VKRGKRYRYYALRPLATAAATIAEVRDAMGSSGATRRSWRLPAHEVERVVTSAIGSFLTNPSVLLERLELGAAPPGIQADVITRAESLAVKLSEGDRDLIAALHELVARITVHEGHLAILLRTAPLTGSGSAPDVIAIDVEAAVRRIGGENHLIVPGEAGGAPERDPDRALLKALARAHAWWEDLVRGRVASVAALAEREGVTGSYVSRVLRLAFLSPEIIEAIMAGRLTLRERIPLAWTAQQSLFAL
jgi:hypothetical protein